ncbi:biotin/lipoyl-binding protein, partial [Thalassolituus sp. UBA1505]
MTTRLNKGHIAALLLSAALILWMAAGSLQSEPDISTNRPLALDNGLPRVQVTHMQGEEVQRDVIVSAHTAPNRRVEVKSEIRAKVIAIHKRKGESVERGELILELDARDWPARVKQAAAALKQRRIEADSARQLAAKGL